MKESSFAIVTNSSTESLWQHWKKNSELRQKALLLKWLFYSFKLSEITSATQNHEFPGYWFIINQSAILTLLLCINSELIAKNWNILFNWPFIKLHHPQRLLLIWISYYCMQPCNFYIM